MVLKKKHKKYQINKKVSLRKLRNCLEGKAMSVKKAMFVKN